MSRWPGRLITKTPITPGGTAPTASAPGIWTLPEMAYWKKRGLWPDASADAYWGYVSYLMATSSLSNGNNNLFVDSSGAFNPVSRSGNTTQGSVTPYGPLWSNYLDGSSYLSAPASTAFAFGTGDFTVECWVNFMPGSVGGRITTRQPGGGAFGSWGFNFSPTTFTFSEVIGGEPGVSASGLPNMTNTWVHLAACRSGSTLRLFANGALVGSGTNTTDFNNSSYSLGIGAAYETAITGYLSNVRIVKGAALYTAAFTPPIAPLTAVAGTSILTCQSNGFRDNSSNAFALTVTGTPRVVPSSPFILNAPGAVYNQSDISYWSGYFNGSGTVNFPANSAFDFGTGNFTIECWVNPTVAGSVYLIGQTASSDYTPVLLYLTSGRPGIAVSPSAGTWTINSAVADALPVNAWSHVAAVRNGNKWSIYVNGVENVIAASTAVTPYVSSDPLGIGGEGVPGLNYPYYGYLSDVRIVKGTAVYTSNFTPPTTPLTAISGTSLLTCQNAAFTDNSTNKFVATVSGTTTVTGNNPYQSGYYSNYFDGSGDYLTTPSNAAFAYGTGDFTWEMWVFPTAANWTTGNYYLMDHGSNGGTLSYYQNVIRYYNSTTGTGSVLYTNGGTIPANQWTHVAVSRSGGTTSLFVNGALRASASDSYNYGTAAVTLANYGSGGVEFQGYISNARIVKGTAVYTGAFTPSTTPLTAITNTSLLTCQSNRFIDNSANNFTITVAGNTAVQSFDPFYTATIASNGGSMYFDGTGDVLLAPAGPSFNFGTSDFTAEFWMYKTSSTLYQRMVAYGGYQAAGNFQVEAGSDTSLAIHVNGGVVSTTVPNLLNNWVHVAVSRQSGSVRVFTNGVLRSTNTQSGSIGQTNSFSVGAIYDATNPYTGYLSDVRITNGTALYTSSFTPPTAPLTPSGNTTLLLNGMNAGEYDATMQSNFETIGNAQASSVQAKYGPTSAYFSGAVDNYITAPNSPAFQFGTNDLTIEAWIYLTGDTITNPDGNRSATICSGIGATGVSNDFWFNVTGNTTTTGTGLNFQVFNGGSGTVIFNTTYSFSKSTWYHVAFTRSGNNVYLFVNGTVVGSTTYSGTITAGTNPLRVGYGQSGSINYRQPFPGYIDDLRITKGVARYTSNFTPPTAALPVY